MHALARPLARALVATSLAVLLYAPAFAQAPGTIQPRVSPAEKGKTAAERKRLARRGSSQRLKAPAPSSAGHFTGTWSRIAPGERHALHLRKNPQTGDWEIRLYWHTSHDFDIDTQWKAHHEFIYQGYAGVLEIKVDQKRSTDDRIVASYMRRQAGERGSELIETGEISIYRANILGRTLVWLQEPLIQEVRVKDTLYPDEEFKRFENRRIWIFDKAAERFIAWDEIYW